MFNLKRKIIKIDHLKCNGCGLCVSACHEGALQLIDGKATLVSESYCDGLGDCLPECPTGAIELEERETVEYDEEAVKKHIDSVKHVVNHKLDESQLRQWPCQLKLVPVNAPFLDNADLLIAADCTAFAYPNIHQEFMSNRITLIGCPKLDNIDYAEKLTEILKLHEIKSITILRMQVPCCGGIVQTVKKALANSGKMIPWSAVTISTDGKILEN